MAPVTTRRGGGFAHTDARPRVSASPLLPPPSRPPHLFRAAPEPGVIADDKDPPRYEPSLRDLPPVGPPIRGWPAPSPSSSLLVFLPCCCTPGSPRGTYPTRVGRLAYVLRRWIFTSDVYERRLRAAQSAPRARGLLALNHSRTYRLPADCTNGLRLAVQRIPGDLGQLIISADSILDHAWSSSPWKRHETISVIDYRLMLFSRRDSLRAT